MPACAASSDPIVILSARRTPMGAFQGALSSVKASTLGGIALKAAREDAGVPPERLDGVLMGCVLPAGQGQAPARQAAHGAGLPWSVPCTTLNKMCGSGMATLMAAHDSLAAGTAQVLAAGGMESMSNAPHLLPHARGGLRMGNARLLDHMFLDGLEDAFDPGRLMGTFAEDTAQALGFSRAEQDAFARASLERARQAQANGDFAAEIVPVDVPGRMSTTRVEIDEAPGKADPARIPHLKPAFREGGTVTAANSSSISDGAAALVLTRASIAEREGWRPLARIRAQAVHAQEPAWFTTAPIGACQAVLDKAGWTVADVDRWEINEAFAVVTLAAMRALDLDPERVNSRGGACALGHPIGASGARIVVTLIHTLRALGGRRGVATLCIGGGEATALAIELVE
ncbi:thiolase family protein [Pararhodospirillum oryzae]|uniref:Acetyl-CoA acetyltransferase n=1 Tax=Pararhodospirillum oryzae TaxID=478448 RepID=A0A512H805_9PROT|nr:acetyl-CoA C-acyltransferase [Pararhodospirillum oryzae]GEO81582.1 acetyl-CoA acetyltransferase [Pararhodospirillum oryzae]